ncbi:formate--tetrahydrofolate ligase [Pseudaquidulcibacter saccharophilus]|uniref:formate--tetrahydrofolate ligase n=1 Tax=Pseudaquidulcibacter saccharophilus TaxID=2831900 RepID=UPI001EFF035C|nr:formate--tetrahydrofolate ligase [Pseudaquidulcibacter saccharophilus]
MATDIEIAHKAKINLISKIAENVGIDEAAVSPHGKYIAKIGLDYLNCLPDNPNAKLVLVTAINPTPAGEGKTTTTIGLGDGLSLLGKKTMLALREPSLGPCFGTKGGATGGGYAQIMPMEDINLHFTGDFHAISSAHNLLAAMIDNHIHWGNELGIDIRRIYWRRVVDMNDRALRNIVSSLGGVNNGFPREDGFDITVASEIMAIFCLAKDIEDLTERIGNIIIGYRRDKTPVYARDLNAQGAMAVLLRNALSPNLVQTLEGTPALVHGGPFANIAHGCNSVIATRSAMKLADYVVTEAGFGADLGAEKFFDIKCRKSGLKPDAVVLVATIRALKMHGGVDKKLLGQENIAALQTGAKNLERHIQNIRKFGIEPIIAINHFITDTQGEIDALHKICREQFGLDAIFCDHWRHGGKGAIELANRVIESAESGNNKFHTLYNDNQSIEEKLETIAREIYHADGLKYDAKIKARFQEIEDLGFGKLPVCVAKTQYSFSSDPKKLGAPIGHSLEVRELRLSAGAGFIVAICGDIMTMPGLPRHPAAELIGIDEKGEVFGLF